MTVCPRCHLEIPAAAQECDCTPEPPPHHQPDEPRRTVTVYSERLRVDRDRAYTRHADERRTIR